MASSTDLDHPGENIIDGRMDSFWISTGLFPQEIVVQTSYPVSIESIRIACTGVRSFRIEASQEDVPVNFDVCLAEGEIEDAGQGRLQIREFEREPSEYDY